MDSILVVARAFCIPATVRQGIQSIRVASVLEFLPRGLVDGRRTSNASDGITVLVDGSSWDVAIAGQVVVCIDYPVAFSLVDVSSGTGSKCNDCCYP